MRKFVTFILIFSSAVVVNAASKKSAAPAKADKPTVTKSAPMTEAKSETKISKTDKAKKWFKEHSSIALFFATADNMSTNSYSSNGSTGWASLSTSPSFGVMAQISDKMTEKWNWYAQASLEQEHEVNSLKTGTSGPVQTLNFTAKPGFRPLLLGGGFEVHPHKIDRFYYKVGFNLPLITTVNTGDLRSLNMNGEFGWQMSAGMKLKKEISLELGWREIRYNTSATKQDSSQLQFGSIAYGGVSLTGRYTF